MRLHNKNLYHKDYTLTEEELFDARLDIPAKRDLLQDILCIAGVIFIGLLLILLNVGVVV